MQIGMVHSLIHETTIPFDLAHTLIFQKFTPTYTNITV